MKVSPPQGPVFGEELRRLVAPAGWKNPEPAPRYNLVVVGAGTAGLVTAAGAAGLGAKVALVERELLGGDCLNVGCVPSKALLRCARAAAEVRGAGSLGVWVPPGASVNFPAVMERMRRLRAQLAVHDSAERFAGLGVDVFFGEARFSGPRALEVGGKTLRFRRACIATGARPAVPPIAGLAEAGYWTNVTIFSLPELPRRLLVVGGGPIGCEMAQAFARFGSKVSLVEAGERLLPRDDPDASEVVQSALKRDGVEIRLGRKLESAEGADAILVAAGRLPNVEGLGLEKAGVAFDESKGVSVDDRLQTTNPAIFAAGDVCSRYKFTHMADAQARIVLRNALFPFGRQRASDLIVPWCTYTDPEVAHVGAFPGGGLETIRIDLAEVDRAVLDGETEGFLKVHFEKRSGRIAGATLVSAHAGETISEIGAVMQAKGSLQTLSGTIHPYPTQSESLRKAGDAFLRSRLTPLAQRLLRRYLAWRR